MLWIQGAIQRYGAAVKTVCPAQNASDILAHPMGESEMKESGWGIHDPARCWGNQCGTGSLGKRVWPSGDKGTAMARVMPACTQATQYDRWS